ncbi:arrestin domain-containing protein 3-like [Amphibalanus amphitrite]|uniref:arrestin domain-containing protein 3-like n=1 Tax=Amphibalanus amphitrite TaxID=1232801 RepID=UPI001C924271|nr:arrestin domain-containing protein 3-like [Amphibalanus amphitrite]
MGIHSVSISFRGETAGYATYRPGETVHGVMTLIIGGCEPHKLSSVLVKVRGLAKSLWKTHSGSGKNRHTHTHTEDLWLIREDIFFIRGPTVEALHPGTYQYAFSHQLRLGLPPTYSCQYGTISYMCKARAISHDLFAFNGKSEYTFTVLPALDLNAEPANLAEPASVTAEAQQSLFGHAIGRFTLTMSPQAAVGGQTISFTIDGPERLFRKQLNAPGVVKLKRCTLCIANGRRREEKRDVAVVQPGQSPNGWHRFELTVPRHEGITISAVMCRIITVTYYVKIKSRHITLSLPLVLGTVPFHRSHVRSRSVSPRPTAPSAAGGIEPRRRSAWADSPSLRPPAEHHSSSAPALAAAPDYDPPPSYEQVMRDQPHSPGRAAAGGGTASETERRHKKEHEATGFTFLGDM